MSRFPLRSRLLSSNRKSPSKRLRRKLSLNRLMLPPRFKMRMSRRILPSRGDVAEVAVVEAAVVVAHAPAPKETARMKKVSR